MPPVEILLGQEEAVTAERDLILKAQAGESDAFGELVQRYMRRAYYAALGFVGSPEDAMDLSQDAFARAYRARHRINPDMPFYTWYYQILRRLCFNFTRDRSLHRRKIRDQKSWIVDDATFRSSERDPQRNIEREEIRRKVREAIDTLPDREREVLVLKEFEGLKYREIAEVVGIPIGTVMSRLYSARKHLAAAIEEMER
jgi:RNA polymerase sigma-70 factor (ECF subfamily)